MSEVLPAVPPPPPPPSRPATTFDFVRPFAFAFEDPEWVQKILLGGLFTLASFVLIGAFFVYGYLARLVRNVVDGMSQPLPPWDDLGEYFMEGIRLFAVVLVYSLPVILGFGAVVMPAIVAEGLDSEVLRNLSGAMTTLVSCLLVPLSLALAVWMPAALLMAVVTRQFSAAFDFARIWGFLRANAGNYILAYVVWLIARMVAPLGFMLLCIGVVFTMFWSFIVGAYAFAQAYRLSVTR